jgi:hypothetical protein
MSGGFFGNIIRYLVQDVVVHTLANSKRFQRMALRIDNFFSTTQKTVESKAEDIAKGAEKAFEEVQKQQAQKAVNPTAKTKSTPGGFDPILFMNHLAQEVKNDIEGKKQ